MEFKLDEIKNKYKLVTPEEFMNLKGGVTFQALSYMYKKDLIDYVKITKRHKLVVMNEKALNYEPNSSSAREAKTLLG